MKLTKLVHGVFVMAMLFHTLSVQAVLVRVEVAGYTTQQARQQGVPLGFFGRRIPVSLALVPGCAPGSKVTLEEKQAAKDAGLIPFIILRVAASQLCFR